MKNFFNETTRKYVYGLTIAAIPVLIYFKLMPAEAAPVILPLILAILNVNEPQKAVQPLPEPPETGHGR